MKLYYTLEFFDYWHISSGLSGGAELDSYVVKDSNSLPYVPGKTIKGLVREMAELLGDTAFVLECFGDEGVQGGLCHFTNVELGQQEQEEIITNRLQSELYSVIAATQIDEQTGIAVDNSLREIEVVQPLTLQGTISDLKENSLGKMQQALQLIKRMGLNRNRGLGRCTIKDFRCKN